MKIVNSTGDALAVFVKYDEKGLPRFSTMNTNSVFTIRGNLGTDFLIEFHSLVTNNSSIIIKYLSNTYSIEEKKGFVVEEELNQDETYGPIIRILSKNYS